MLDLGFPALDALDPNFSFMCLQGLRRPLPHEIYLSEGWSRGIMPSNWRREFGQGTPCFPSSLLGNVNIVRVALISGKACVQFVQPRNKFGKLQSSGGGSRVWGKLLGGNCFSNEPWWTGSLFGPHSPFSSTVQKTLLEERIDDLPFFIERVSMVVCIFKSRWPFGDGMVAINRLGNLIK